MKIEYDELPSDLVVTIKRYIEFGCPTGDFLRAVLGNDLKEAFGRADINNRHRLFEIVSWLYNNAPNLCWGSYKKVHEWINTGGATGTAIPKTTQQPPAGV